MTESTVNEGEEERPLRILSENPIEGIWTQLSLWESERLARKLIAERADEAGIEIAAELIDRKALALSYCIRTARENIRAPFVGLTVSSVCNYYGCMWLAAAVLASDPSNNVDLARLEDYTKRGHGLGNLASETGDFPDNEYLYVRESGFFREFLKANGTEKSILAGIALSGGRVPPLAEMSAEQRQRLLPLDALLARIPEIRPLYEYVTGRTGLSFDLAHSSSNYDEAIKDAQQSGTYNTAFPRRVRNYTWLTISGSSQLSKAHIQEHGPPLSELEWGNYAGRTAWRAKLSHPIDTFWYRNIDLHRSAMSGTCWIKPLFGTVSDIFAIHLMLLYALSILARYRPAVWREVLEGQRDEYRALIMGYHNVFQRVLPELALRRISARELHVTMPGSFTAPL